MNERIRELMEQATEEELDYTESGVPFVVREFVPEKFAELIITETCRMLVENSELRAATLVGRHFPLWK